MIEIIIYIIFGGAFLIMLSGAYLLIQDADKLHSERKRLKEKYPNLNREQIKLLARLNLTENTNE